MFLFQLYIFPHSVFSSLFSNDFDFLLVSVSEVGQGESGRCYSKAGVFVLDMELQGWPGTAWSWRGWCGVDGLSTGIVAGVALVGHEYFDWRTEGVQG